MATGFIVSFIWILAANEWNWNRLWLTQAQSYSQAFKKGDFKQAVKLAGNPLERGVAYYRNGDFKSATMEFQRLNTPSATFNLGNSLVFQGKYEEAIAAYERALDLAPDWKEAIWNKQICEARLKALEPPEDDAGGTGGKLEADEIVIDDRASKNPSAQKQEVQMGQEKLSEEEIRALWLRRVQTKPADFLKYKFAYQADKGDGE